MNSSSKSDEIWKVAEGKLPRSRIKTWDVIINIAAGGNRSPVRLFELVPDLPDPKNGENPQTFYIHTTWFTCIGNLGELAGLEQIVVSPAQIGGASYSNGVIVDIFPDPFGTPCKNLKLTIYALGSFNDGSFSADPQTYQIDGIYTYEYVLTSQFTSFLKFQRIPGKIEQLFTPSLEAVWFTPSGRTRNLQHFRNITAAKNLDNEVVVAAIGDGSNNELDITIYAAGRSTDLEAQGKPRLGIITCPWSYTISDARPPADKTYREVLPDGQSFRWQPLAGLKHAYSLESAWFAISGEQHNCKNFHNITVQIQDTEILVGSAGNGAGSELKLTVYAAVYPGDSH